MSLRKGPEGKRIALAVQDIRECERAEQGGPELGERGPLRVKMHGRGVINEQQCSSRRVAVALFDVVAVGAGEELPVEIAQILSRMVFAVLGKFQTAPPVRERVESDPGGGSVGSEQQLLLVQEAVEIPVCDHAGICKIRIGGMVGFTTGGRVPQPRSCGSRVRRSCPEG